MSRCKCTNEDSRGWDWASGGGGAGGGDNSFSLKKSSAFMQFSI